MAPYPRDESTDRCTTNRLGGIGNPQESRMPGGSLSTPTIEKLTSDVGSGSSRFTGFLSRPSGTLRCMTPSGNNEGPSSPATGPETAHAYPEKDFFISMITRDIGLEACILDLVDNSVDSARRFAESQPSPKTAKPLERFKIELSLNGNQFKIKDNCGGIPTDKAINYAFHFGRPRNSPSEGTRPIGLYGIGMKRALFKLGNDISVRASTANDGFEVSFKVDEWQREREWDFPLARVSDRKSETSISVRELSPGVGDELTDKTFEERLRRSIAKVYSPFLRDGLEIHINERPVRPFDYRLLTGAELEPLNFEEKKGGVSVRVSAGLAAPLPDDPESEDFDEAETWGWFVVCNGRVVLAGDKTERTGWGLNKIPGWHNQYNGFLGIVEFESEDASSLPWTTTKSDVVRTSAVYRFAMGLMKEAMRTFIDYTNVRKGDVEKARTLEKAASSVPVKDLPARRQMKLPTEKLKREPNVKIANILYQRPVRDILKVAAALGNPSMSYKLVGEQTFDFFFDSVVGK